MERSEVLVVLTGLTLGCGVLAVEVGGTASQLAAGREKREGGGERRRTTVKGEGLNLHSVLCAEPRVGTHFVLAPGVLQERCDVPIREEVGEELTEVRVSVVAAEHGEAGCMQETVAVTIRPQRNEAGREGGREQLE